MQNSTNMRILELLRFLYERTDENHPATVSDIIAHLNGKGIQAVRQTVYADTNALIDAGIDIVVVKSTQNQYFMGNRLFEYPELKMLTDAVASSKIISAKKSEELVQKLCRLTSLHQAKQLQKFAALSSRVKPHNEKVYYIIDNAASDMTNPRGAGTTYFHELAHMIDHASCNYRSNLSNTPEFAEALVEDGQRILSLYNNLPVEKQTAFLTRIRQDSAHSFSDLIDATTNGQLHGNYGHSRNYWTRPGNLQAEAFAHFFEASMGDQGKLELLANFFPTAFGIFSSMIDSIRPDNHVRVLSRER